MPFLTTIGSSNLLGFGLSSNAVTGGNVPPTPSTKYFFNFEGYQWDTLANWFNDSAHTDAAGSYPSTADDVVLKSLSIVDLIGRVSGTDPTYASWENQGYWAPPASIDAGGFDITFRSDEFSANYKSGWATGQTYALGDMVTFNDHYRAPVRIAADVPLVNGELDTYYWSPDYINKPYINITITNAGTVTLIGVDNGISII
jgi:hypothetical protein